MISARRIITILGTLFCAGGTGFFMQHYMQAPDRSAPGSIQVASVSAIQDVVPLVEQALAAPAEEEEVQLEDIALTEAT